MHVILPVLPAYVGSLGIGSEVALGWIMDVFNMGATLAKPIGGWMGDRVTEKPVLVIGNTIYFIVPALYLAGSGVPALAAIRVLAGFGLGFQMVASFAMVPLLVGERQRGMVFGLLSSVSSLSFITGPPVAERVFASRGAGPTFWTAAAIAMVGMVLAVSMRGRTRTGDGGTGQPANVTAPPDHDIPMPAEAHIAECAPPRTAWPAVVIPCLVLCAGSFGFGALTSFGPLHAAERGLTVGLMLAVFGLSNIAGRIVGGRAADRWEPRAINSLGCLLQAAGMFLLAQARTTTGLYLAALSYGLGIGPVMPTLAVDVLRNASLQQRGLALGVLTAGFDMGMAVGAITLGPVVRRFGFKMGFWVSGAVALAGLVLYLSARPGQGARALNGRRAISVRAIQVSQARVGEGPQ